MGKFLKKINNNIELRENCKNLTKQDLENYKSRGIELKELVTESISNKEYKQAEKYSKELASIIKLLKYYKKVMN